MRVALALMCASVAVVGCTGTVSTEPGPTDPGGDGDASCAAPSPGRAPLRRLTVLEYDNTVRDLFGDASRPAARLVDTERDVVNADARRMTPLLAEQYLAAAEDVAARAVPNLGDLVPCDRAARGDAGCAEAAIDALAPRLFRRPITADERAALLGVYTDLADLGFDEAMGAVIAALLQAPQFLYRLELAPVGAAGVVRLDGYQVATRLSYLLWSTTPDPALTAAAAAGDLDDVAGVERHARRMLADPRAQQSMQRFFGHWLELDKVDGTVKDPETFPDFDDQIRALMRAEVELFIEQVLQTDRSWRTLLTAPWTMADDQLAAYYGLPTPGTGDFERVDLDPAYHAGLLTKGGLLASRDRAYETSPIHRGMFLRAGFICGEVPDVPEGLEVTPPDPDPSKTTRERLAEHRADPVCASCHDLIDPLGFALEHFDGAGRFRATENGLPIDASGTVLGSDFDGAVDGAADLAAQLVDSDMAQRCFVGQWFSYAHARSEEASDACSVDRTAARFRQNQFDVGELLVALATSDTFLYRDIDANLEGGAP